VEGLRPPLPAATTGLPRVQEAWTTVSQHGRGGGDWHARSATRSVASGLAPAD
jgi:hypothetical protein